MTIGGVTLALVCGCTQTTGGAPGPTVTSDAVTTPPSATAAPTAGTATSEPTTETVPPYGVLETTKRPLASGEVTCEAPAGQANTVAVTGTAAGAPTVVVPIPEGFHQTAPTADAQLILAGPADMTATVSITPTTADAATALRQYADQRVAGYSFSSLSVLPGDLCGYSGQELMGNLSNSPGPSVEFNDRVVHVWTGSGDFLVAIDLQAPTGTAGFDEAGTALLADFGIRMP